MDRLIADLRHMTASWDAPAHRVVARAVPRLLVTPRFRAVVLFRASAWCWHHRLRPVALWLQGCTIRSAGAEIHPAAVIGPGLQLSHSVGIVVGHEVVAGTDLVLFQGVTLGHGASGNGQPRIGDGVRIGAGAILLGPISIGDGARIAAGSLVLADVPAGMTVRGEWRG